MIRLNGKLRSRVSNKTALVAALLLALSTAITLQGSETEPVNQIDVTQPTAVKAANPGPDDDGSSQHSKINLKTLLFRHG